MSLEGFSPVYTEATGGGGAMVYVQMLGTAGQTLPSGVFTEAIFDDPAGETNPPQYDPYELRSTTTLDGYSTDSVAAGSAIGPLSAEMAGIWQVSTLRKIATQPAAASGRFYASHQGFTNINAGGNPHLTNIIDTWMSATQAGVLDRFTSLQQTCIVAVGEGDYIWADAGVDTSDGSDGFLEKIVLTAIRIAALPPEPS